MSKTFFYKDFIRIWAKRVLSVFSFIYVFYLLQEIIVLNYYQDANSLSFNFLKLLEFFVFDFLAVFAVLLTISLSFSLAWSFHFVSKNNHLLLLELSGLSSLKIAIVLSIVLPIISLFLFFVHEGISKPIARQNQIIYEDEIVKKTYLQSNLTLSPKEFIRLKKGTYLYFSSLVLDEVDHKYPKLYNIIVWNKEKSKNDKIILAKSVNVIGKQILFPQAYEYTFQYSKVMTEVMVHRIHNIDLTWHEKMLQANYESVNPRLLSVIDLYKLFRINKNIGLGTNKYLIFLIEPFLVFIFLPLLIVILVFGIYHQSIH